MWLDQVSNPLSQTRNDCAMRSSTKIEENECIIYKLTAIHERHAQSGINCSFPAAKQLHQLLTPLTQHANESNDRDNVKKEFRTTAKLIALTSCIKMFMH